MNYDIKGLINQIALGQIGLPDIQRPFVWKNVKVRDLFDSMYRGYPVGYLLFWETGTESLAVANPHQIGTEGKQLAPQLMIVDGQQRLTSLYSVIKGLPVLRENYNEERIRIAFNPLEEKFEVTSAAIERDKAFFPEISPIWSGETNIFQLVSSYLAELESVRNVSASDKENVQNSFIKLMGLENFPLTALQLSSDTSEENVSEVFVRINSQGKNLNQADFILTLMSVFWDEGRAEMEKFCRDSRIPSKSGPSPFNYFIEPFPDQLLRVSVGLAFKRAALRHVYSILRGKNLETEQFSEQHRIQQFDELKKAQAKTLNLQYWHDFMKCIREAGFRSSRMIRSQNNLLFCYILYLMGRTEYKVKESTLRRLIAQWFFMSSLTRRYSSSPESSMESDLAMLRGVTGADDFVARLQRVCGITLTDDFWEVTLPNELANSSVVSPSLSVYEAGQVLLDSPVLFSKSKIGDLIDPAIHANRASVERHHLYPKGHLAKLNILETRQTNQIANLAYLEWSENTRISDQSPSQYIHTLKERFTEAEVSAMYQYHALPQKWPEMEYDEFLERRRELMAEIIHKGYRVLTEDVPVSPIDDELIDLISTGESDSVEFKSTLRVSLHTGNKDSRMEDAVLRTLAGFLNTNGGTLIIGIRDDGTPVGIALDRFENEDRMNLHLVNMVNVRMGGSVMPMVHTQFDDYEDSRVLRAVCERSPRPVYIKEGLQERLYIRSGPSTVELTGSQMVNYIKDRFDQ